MTEAGEKWALEKAGGSFVFESEEAEFWLRAFCDQVEKSVKMRLKRGDGPEFIVRQRAFDELKRELLGEL